MVSKWDWLMRGLCLAGEWGVGASILRAISGNEVGVYAHSRMVVVNNTLAGVSTIMNVNVRFSTEAAWRGKGVLD